MKSRDGEVSSRLSLPIAEQVAGTVRPHGLVPLSWMGGKVVDTMREPVKTECGEGTSPWHPSLSPNLCCGGGCAAGRQSQQNSGGSRWERIWITAVVQ